MIRLSLIVEYNTMFPHDLGNKTNTNNPTSTIKKIINMAKKKSLQKFTDIEKIETKKQLQDFLELNPKAKDKIWTSLLDRMNETYGGKLGNEYDIMNLIEEYYLITKGANNNAIVEMKNLTYEANHILITGYIHNFILENRYFPTVQYIKKETGLSRTTIYKHLESGLKSKHNKLINGKMELMTTKAMEKLYLIGIQDNNATALKNFIELSGVSAKNNITNNYIQTNNIKISNEDFNSLPSEIILEVEQIISKNRKG